MENLKQEEDKFNTIEEYITEELMDKTFGQGTYDRYIQIVEETTLKKR